MPAILRMGPHRRLLVMLLLGLAAVSLWVIAPSSPAAAQAGPLVLTVSADKEAYAAGEEARFTLQVRNAGPNAVTVTRPTAQAFDFVVRHAGQRPIAAIADQVWAWSDNRQFALAAEQMTIEPGRTLTFSETWDQRDRDGKPVGPGTYNVQGIFITNENIQPAVDTFTIGQGSPGAGGVTVNLAAVGASNVRGTATLTAQNSGTQVAFDVSGLPAGANAEARLQAGTCAQPSASSAQLPDLRADVGGRAQVTGPVLFRGVEPVALSTLLNGNHVITVSQTGGAVACGPIPAMSTTPTMPPNSAWFSAPPGTAAARPSCPDPNQWALLYWGGGNEISVMLAAEGCVNADRYWANQDGRWLGFSPASPQASDVWSLQTGVAVFLHGAAGQTGTGTCPTAPAVCAFAAEISRSLQNGDFDAISARAQFREFQCPGSTPAGLGGPFPLCDGANQGERRSGIIIAYLSSEGTVVSQEGLKNALRGWVTGASPPASDEFGTGEPRLFSVGCPFTQTAPAPQCPEQFSVVFSQHRQGIPVRGQLIFFIRQSAAGGSAQITDVAIGPILPEDQLPLVLRGGLSSAIFSPEGYEPFGTYYAWTPDAIR